MNVSYVLNFDVEGSSMGALKDKVAVVTGGRSGIGLLWRTGLWRQTLTYSLPRGDRKELDKAVALVGRM